MENKIGMLFPAEKDKICERWRVIVGFDYSRGMHLARCAYANYGMEEPLKLVSNRVKLYTCEEAIESIHKQIQEMDNFRNLLMNHREPKDKREETEFNRLFYSYLGTQRLVDSYKDSDSHDAQKARRGLRGVKKRMFNYYGDYALKVMVELQRFRNDYTQFSYGVLLDSIEKRKNRYLGAIMYIQETEDEINKNRKA